MIILTGTRCKICFIKTKSIFFKPFPCLERKIVFFLHCADFSIQCNEVVNPSLLFFHFRKGRSLSFWFLFNVINNFPSPNISLIFLFRSSSPPQQIKPFLLIILSSLSVIILLPRPNICLFKISSSSFVLPLPLPLQTIFSFSSIFLFWQFFYRQLLHNRKK